MLVTGDQRMYLPRCSVVCSIPLSEKILIFIDKTYSDQDQTSFIYDVSKKVFTLNRINQGLELRH